MKIMWIKIYEYANKHNVPMQTVYRWIRERKIPEDSFKRKEITVEKLFIREDFPCPKRRKKQ